MVVVICLLFLAYFSPSAALDKEWTVLDPDQWKKDGDSQYVFGKAELQYQGEPRNKTAPPQEPPIHTGRFKFDLGAIVDGIARWDHNRAGQSQMYADLDAMRALQLTVSFSECDSEANICWRTTEDKSVWLGVLEDAAEPQEDAVGRERRAPLQYALLNASNEEVTVHTSFCAHPPLEAPWLLSIAAAGSRYPSVMRVQLRATLLRAHAVAGTWITLTQPSVALFALPIETTGWAEEQVVARARVYRAADASPNVHSAALDHVHVTSLGIRQGCPRMPLATDYTPFDRSKVRLTGNRKAILDVC